MQKIFIIHGWTYTLEAWDACLAELRMRGFEPIMLRVSGLTSPSADVWDLEKYVAWLENELKDEKEIILAGHSNGGRIAIAYAAKNPLALKKLILIDAAGIVHNEPLLRAKRKIFGAISKIGKPLSKLPLLDKVYHRLIGANDYGKAPANMKETMKKLILVDLFPLLPKISVPTMIIWGERDTATPVSDAHAMNAGIKNAELFIISDAGHSPHKTDPAIVAEKIASFVR